MDSNLISLFNDNKMIKKIKLKFPYLFQLAEAENTRAGKIGMEIGTTRERIIISLLIFKFGDSLVNTQIPTTEAEIDVILGQNPISIKTITNAILKGVKLSWTVDATKALDFVNNYTPSCEMLLAQINWNNNGAFFYFPLEVQKEVFNLIGRDAYFVLPKLGTNPRGVEISESALSLLSTHKNSHMITIHWVRQDINYNQFVRWVELWAQE
ncbi:type II restriction endonuclease subunit R [Candidatus Gottesmanbacteria bacterium]|nr:type II restriction endonuclease subunit R [Candidatus Gottesmanbacteria bacterium]